MSTIDTPNIINSTLQVGTSTTAGYLLTADTSGNATWQAAPAGGLSWAAATGDATMTVGHGYLANKGTLLTLTLPTTSAVGTSVRVAGMNAGLWKIAQAAGQYIKFGNQNTTTGTGGYLASVLTYDAVELICIVADTGWTVVSSLGNITIV